MKIYWQTPFVIVILLLALALIPNGGAMRASDNVPAAGTIAYLPLITRAAADLRLDLVEVTQSVQNGAGSVPMVAGRATVARVYVTGTGVAQIDGVVVEVSATRNGVALPGSPRRSGPRAVTTSSSRGDYASSFNVALPADWLSGDIQLSIVVDPDNVIAEANETNNRASRTLTFLSVPQLAITVVPIQYTHLPNGRVYPAPARDTISDWILRSYPVSQVNVTLRAPVAFTGDLRSSAEWERLLDLVTTVKQSDGAVRSRVYYGLVPIANGTDRWFSSGIAGIGWVGQRASVGLDLAGTDEAGQLAAHEIGHNLGRYHAPCGVSGDPRQPFPYASASIGMDVYGLDISRARVWSPVAPDTTKDVMSYCRPQWLSDFTYQGLLDNQRTNGGAEVQNGSGLLVRAVLADNGSALLEPVYALADTALDPPLTSEYMIEVLDASGVRLAAYPVAVLEAEGPYHYGAEAALHDHTGEHAYRRIAAVVPAPRGVVARLRLIHNGIALAEQTLAGAPVAAVPAPALQGRDQGGFTLSWPNPMVPALVRYTHDGTRWTTLGVDVTGGRLEIDAQALPGGGSGRFEIVPAGGGTATMIAGASIAAAPDDVPPQVWIDGPDTLPAGAPLLLTGRASDREDGAVADMTWTLDGVTVGTDQVLIMDGPAPGTYRFTLTARDRSGNRVSVEHRVVVQ